jgi:hypothetical protein
MKLLENGRRAWLISLVALTLSVVSALGGWYTGWRSNIEASVVERQLINDNDAKLRGLIDDFQANDRLDAVQQTRIESQDKSIEKLLDGQIRADERVSRLSDIVFFYVKQRMADGEVPKR